jgi:hypothetical protein
MRLKTNLPHKTVATTILLFLIISPFFIAEASSLQLTATEEYLRYVHPNITASGNSTHLDKPIFPVIINSGDIQIGQNWTIICPLQAGHNYHVYCYGSWVNFSSAAKTDYDIYVFGPSGNLESSHTEAAGLPEHLGSTANDAFFTPQQTGNYSFVIKNDERQSQGSEPATFMVIENLECDRWYSSPVEGQADDNTSNLHTKWAYEFMTNESQIELYVKVPSTLDMYEARLYLMNNPSSLEINSVPLPWEPGLDGKQSGATGGYNFESDGNRGVAYASCEYMGQTMYLNYTSTMTGMKLYHLVLIGEQGSGNVEFMLKTKFGNTILSPLTHPARILPNQPVPIAYISENASLQTAKLSYSTNDWASASVINMEISNRTCNTTIPGQTTGSVVQYRVDVNDSLNNAMTATGNYSVKEQPTLNFIAAEEVIVLGENVTFTGILTPSNKESTVMIDVFSASSTETLTCRVLSDGTFSASFQPSTSGNWSAVANSPETQTSWRCDSAQLLITVKEPPIYIKYSTYIIIVLAAVSAAGGAIWFLKFRGR